MGDWFQQRSAYESVLYNEPGLVKPLPIFQYGQRLVLKRLRNMNPELLGPFLNRRLAYFFEHVYKENKVTLGAKFMSTHLRTIINHWCTNRRCCRDCAECPFGCNAGHDGITHALLCPRFQSEVELVLRLPANALTLRGLLLFLADGACVHSLVASKI